MLVYLPWTFQKTIDNSIYYYKTEKISTMKTLLFLCKTQPVFFFYSFRSFII